MSTFDKTVGKIFGNNPYEGFQVDENLIDFRQVEHPSFAALLRTVKPKIIIEVGSWKGASAISMAKTAASLNLDTVIICVDTWLGSAEHWLSDRSKTDDKDLSRKTWGFESLRLNHGYPSMYFTFLTNVASQGLSDRIIPLPATSENAFHILKRLNLKPDLIYIDAAHDYQAVYRDLSYYWELLSNKGVLFGDDYKMDGVAQAAQQFHQEVGKTLYSGKGKFIIPKSDRDYSKFKFVDRVKSVEQQPAFAG